ncbi:MAG TPA: hypothetical protein GXX20_09150 [Clostridiaceae bacterium]|nr:hypothetical protein [Clostridiaceae bacterium]
MMSKYLEKKVIVFFDGENNKEKDLMELEYYLTESDEFEPDEIESYNLEIDKQYGVEIVKIVNGTMIENKLIKNLTNCRDQALEVLKKLIYNTVTPMSMLPILDDLLGAL